MPSSSHFCRFYHPNNVGWAVQIIKFLVMYFSPLPCYLVPLTIGYYLQKHNKLNEDIKRVFCFIFFSKLHGENIKLHVVRIKLICVCEYVLSYCSWYLHRFLGTTFYQVKASNGKGATRGHPDHRTSLSHIRCLYCTKLFLYKKDITFRWRG
jgi:hypothetical protein